MSVALVSSGGGFPVAIGALVVIAKIIKDDKEDVGGVLYCWC